MLKIIIFIYTLMLPFTSLSHTAIEFLSPENGSILSEPPKDITIIFVYSAMFTKFEMLKTDSNDEKIELKKDFLQKSSDTHLVSLPVLERGEYRVEWRALAQDGHVIKGKFAFKIN